MFSQILFWESDASGTGGKVPGRYGGKLEKLFWPYEMAGKENGLPLPISLQKKLVFQKGFQQIYRDVILSRETISHSL